MIEQSIQNEDLVALLLARLKTEEGYRQYPYKDTTGHLTIGYGRNLDAEGISKLEAETLLQNDIDYFLNKLSDTLPFFDNLSIARKVVLVDMCFNLGFNGLMDFKSMLGAIKNQSYNEAAQYMLLSKAATQNRRRYQGLANLMERG